MDRSDARKWHGLKMLVQDAVEHGSRAVERIQLETAKVPFQILEQIPVVAAPAKLVHVVHDATVSVTHASIRGVTKLVGRAIDVVLVEPDETTRPTS